VTKRWSSVRSDLVTTKRQASKAARASGKRLTMGELFLRDAREALARNHTNILNGKDEMELSQISSPPSEDRG